MKILREAMITRRWGFALLPTPPPVRIAPARAAPERVGRVYDPVAMIATTAEREVRLACASR